VSSLDRPPVIGHPAPGQTPGGTNRSKAAARHLWGHFTDQGKWAAGDVPTVVRGEGAYFYDSAGRRIFDGLSGLFVVQVGHGREELARAAAAQARELAFFPLWGYAHTPAIDLAERLAHLAPGDLNHVFFTTGGGEGVEGAWKLAKAYWALRGKPSKRQVISRAGAYHGTTHGALSLTRIEPYSAPFVPLVPGAHLAPNTNFYRAGPQYWQDEEAFGKWAADGVEEAIVWAGPDNVAALFVEPVQNSGGCFTPPPGYFARLRQICDAHQVLLVSDEVICAFGRTGGYFAYEDFGYTPDIVVSSKGLTSGYVPLGALLASEEVYEPFSGSGQSFKHGSTFGGHPVGAAVALANLDLFEREGLVDRVRDLSGTFHDELESLKDIPIVGDIRGAGYFFGIELTRDQSTRERFTDKEADLIRAYLNPALYDAGLYARADDRGDVVLQLAPPLTCGVEDFKLIGETLRGVLGEVAAGL
jgi:adenosylmethionine-8-amino-7-oxononanoate aminotransferase